MNTIERCLHTLVEPYPFLRIPLVAAYQRVCAIIPSADFQSGEVIARPGFFFGFHDKCPWSSDNKRLLAHKFDIRKPLREIESSPVEIGYFEDGDLKTFRKLGTTRAWNWQQGSMLQWLGDTDYLIYNDVMDGKDIARITDLDGRTVETLPLHIAHTSPNGKLALSYCYRRLAAGMNGYGYYSHTARAAFGSDKLRIVNLESGAGTEIFALHDFARLQEPDKSKGAHHFFYYGQFSPDGRRIAFYHRWLSPMGRMETRLYTADLSGARLFNVSGADFTHMTWRDADRILSYFRPTGEKIGFYLVKDLDGRMDRIGEGVLASDGHPQFSADRRYILVDTYPDRLRNQCLKIFDCTTNTETLLIRKRIPFDYRYERRCDYHPRYDRENRQVCFDSPHAGGRALCVLQL